MGKRARTRYFPKSATASANKACARKERRAISSPVVALQAMNLCLGLGYFGSEALTEADSQSELCLKREGEAALGGKPKVPKFRLLWPKAA